MFPSSANTGPARNTSHNLVLPFYIYAAVSFLIATLLLFISSSAFVQHYFHPQTLTITHIMALGWGTMMILGASHQLVPVLIESKLFSEPLGYASFVLAGLGVPLLVYAFYYFQFGWQAQWGGILINAAVLIYLVNIAVSMVKSKKENIHAIFVFTATLWLLITTLIGLFLVYNFTENILSFDSLHYLPLHAHLGIVGWFLLMVFGVGSRLIPMFLISKYNHTKLLWWIYALINIALVIFIVIFLYSGNTTMQILPICMVAAAIVLFARYCYHCYKERLRKKVDEPIKLSLLSIGMMIIPVLFLLINIVWLLFSSENTALVITYGFCIFFGWITTIILGMSFKTLPFILWNKTYHTKARMGKTPNPKDLFSTTIFKWMAGFYLAGFIGFLTGSLSANELILKSAALLLVIAAVLYNFNVFKMIYHKPKT